MSRQDWCCRRGVVARNARHMLIFTGRRVVPPGRSRDGPPQYDRHQRFPPLSMSLSPTPLCTLRLPDSVLLVPTDSCFIIHQSPVPHQLQLQDTDDTSNTPPVSLSPLPASSLSASFPVSSLTQTTRLRRRRPGAAVRDRWASSLDSLRASCRRSMRC